MRKLFIDPSYSNTGLFYIDGTNYSTGSVSKNSKITTYLQTVSTAVNVVHEIKNFTQTRPVDCFYIEIPPVFGFNTSKLWGLSFLLYTELSKLACVKLIRANMVSALTKKSFKEDSDLREIVGEDKKGKPNRARTKYAKFFLSKLNLVPVDVVTWDDDIATAFLFYYYTEFTNVEKYID